MCHGKSRNYFGENSFPNNQMQWKVKCETVGERELWKSRWWGIEPVQSCSLNLLLPCWLLPGQVCKSLWIIHLTHQPASNQGAGPLHWGKLLWCCGRAEMNVGFVFTNKLWVFWEIKLSLRDKRNNRKDFTDWWMEWEIFLYKQTLGLLINKVRYREMK